MDIELTNEQRERLENALLAAFDLNNLSRMLLLKLGFNIRQELDVAKGLKFIVTDLVTLAEDGWLDKLLLAADDYRNGQSSKLKAVIGELLLKRPQKESSEIVPVRDPLDITRLEKVVNKRAPFIPFTEFMTKLGGASTRICRIEYPEGQPQGTGWLVGPDLVLTAYHVVEKIHKEENGYNYADICCRFDYDGVQAPKGRPCGLLKDWLEAHSPYGVADLKPNNGEPAKEELDFALVRLDEEVGEDLFPNGNRRGWFEVHENAPVMMENDFVIIPQHPQGRTLELAFGQALQYNRTANRIQYDTNTEHGSSGSPCFNSSMVPFALHHAGGPAEQLDYNQGVPLRQIIRFLKDRNIPSFWKS
ncbi:trypsin-like peptidase domain-containing protein [Chitinophaga tropicalis]|uniref:Serine protease n=1 Tax=Chitinophaga tropicalis TaxID=2683588 RepID=A0A7K1UBZ2_9BACT|nr:trypsin-like peptidase domain-containing protein [Chitinophaga tropicalis]MVT11863.1 hypothetical protein [Chitinophaga tropicalis]